MDLIDSAQAPAYGTTLGCSTQSGQITDSGPTKPSVTALNRPQLPREMGRWHRISLIQCPIESLLNGISEP